MIHYIYVYGIHEKYFYYTPIKTGTQLAPVQPTIILIRYMAQY